MPRLLLRVFAVLALSAGASAFQSPPQNPPIIKPPVPTLPDPRQPPRPIGTPLQAPPVIFRARTDLIQIDASVLDKDRRPVRGLKPEDFTVRENGVVQPIVGFVEMSASDPDAPPNSWMRTVVPDVRVNNAEDGRVLLIVLDDGQFARSPFDTHTREDAFKEVARAIVNRMGPADLAAIIFTMKNKNEQEFTSNHDQLLNAINGFEFPLSTAYADLLASSTFEDAGKILQSIDQRRKAVIMVSARPVNVTPLGFSPHYTDPHPAIVFGSSYLDGATNLKIGGMAQNTLKASLGGNITFYTINPLRMKNIGEEVGQLLDPVTADLSSGFDPPTSGPPKPTSFRDLTIVPLDQATGGFSIRRPEDFAEGVTQIFRESGAYYLLGYANPSPDSDKARKIDVTLTRSDLVVRARGEFLPPKVEKEKPASPLWKAISGLLPSKDLPLRANVASFAIPGKSDAFVAIVLGLREPLPIDATGVLHETVEMMTRAYTPSGQGKGSQAQTIRLDLRPNGTGEVKYELYSLLRLKPGRYHLRMSANSAMQRRSGSVYEDIEIPDYHKLPLSLSSVVLTTKPPLVSGPPNALDAVVPHPPTTQREFAGHTGTAYLQVYEGGKAALADVRLDVVILDEHETTVFSKIDTLPAARFTTKTRASDYQFELPIDRLKPGAHVLTFNATIGEGLSVTRSVRFVVLPPSK